MVVKQKLEIPLLDGSIWSVDADVIGDLAVHAARKAPKELSVTHVPTLLSFRDAVPIEVLGNRAKLKKWMATVQEGLKKDWLAMKKFNAVDVRKHPDLTAKVRERIRTHCLATKS